MARRHGFLGLFWNPVGLLGIVITVTGFTSGVVLLGIDMVRHGSPYIGTLVYMVVPGIVGVGVGVAIVGALWGAWRRKRKGTEFVFPALDLNDAGTMRRLLVVLAVVLVIGVIAALGSYRAYHFMESVEFCGLVCHKVMKPEHTAHQSSPHSNVSCIKCHLAPGVDNFVRAKVGGLHQAYATLRGTYHRPIETPIKNAQKESCYTCHQPNRSFGTALRTWTYFLPDEENSPWTVAMHLDVGNGKPEQGPISGIHWHTSVKGKVEYIAGGEEHKVIPWVRATNPDGTVTVYRTEEEDEVLTEEQVAAGPVKQMDCFDCHNRPAHQFLSPNEALDRAMLARRIDASMPEIKLKAAELLAGEYEAEGQALAAIEKGLREEFADHAGLEGAVREVASIYRNNFFPEMKVSWRAYPDHIAHKETPGCFRCHDGEHVSDSGKKITHACETCHTVVAQGAGRELSDLSPKLEFEHPSEDVDEDEWKEERCDTCHEGVPM